MVYFKGGGWGIFRAGVLGSLVSERLGEWDFIDGDLSNRELRTVVTYS